MAYVERGAGVPLILVHGSLADYRFWAPQMESFSAHYRTFSPSLRHSYPERWNGSGDDFSIRQHAEDLASFIKWLNVGPVHLVAYSRGADVALRLAKTHQELLRSVVLADPVPLDSLMPRTPVADAAAERRKDQITRTLERFRQGDIDGGLEIFLDMNNVPGYWKNAPASAKQVFRDNPWSIKSLVVDAQEPFTCADAGKINVPVLFVTGEKSPPNFGVMRDALQPCLMRQEGSVTIPNAPHGFPRTHSQAFNAAVLKFLARH
jgi:pimeloyl-ACP methyl ester carboxylesterase